MHVDISILHGILLPGSATVRSSALDTKSESGTKWDGLVPNLEIIGQRHPGCGNLALNPVRKPGKMGRIGNMWESLGKIQSYLSHSTTACPSPSPSSSFVQPHSFGLVDTPVIPAKAGIQSRFGPLLLAGTRGILPWIPAFARMMRVDDSKCDGPACPEGWGTIAPSTGFSCAG